MADKPTTNYSLQKTDASSEKTTLFQAIKKLTPLMAAEGRPAIIAFGAILINSATTLAAPIIIGRAVDSYITLKNLAGLFHATELLFLVYLLGLGASYIQTITMGGVGRRVLYNLRNALFTKLQELPVAFFNQNKAGDLISRINNDTDKLNQFFAQALMQFLGNIFMIVGSGIFLLVLDIKLGLAALVPAAVVLGVTQVLSPWVKRTTLLSLRTLGAMSAEVQESLNNFRVIAAFNRLDYFTEKFDQANQTNYKAAVAAGIAQNIFTPIYTFASTLAQLTVVAYGLYLISHGALTLGLLIGFLLYVNTFYQPLRQLAAVWSSLQTAIAALDRIGEVLNLQSNMERTTSSAPAAKNPAVLGFSNVAFTYPPAGNSTEMGKRVLRGATLELLQGKTYALVGPTGGGKTTTASLMARLFDPTEGTVTLSGRDIRSYSAEERAQKIGFILQEPFLFTGTVGSNIIYGNNTYTGYSNEQLLQVLEKQGLAKLLSRFEQGLDTDITANTDAISLGQKQLIAFMRAALREPELLILDEATANIDTVTEQLLEEILKKLPKETTRVIIAHRLNTIENADEIFFVNGGEITPAGTMQQAVEMLLHQKNSS
ncbi:MAG TPA: ABC transporter ATP-binding protein [Candidatus Paceibacterota bacterium]